MQSKNKRYSTVKNLPSNYPDAGFTEASVRWWIFNKEENGFAICMRKIGNRILIDLDLFETWIEENSVLDLM